MAARARYLRIPIKHYRAAVHVVAGSDLAAAYRLARARCPQLADVHSPADAAACLTPEGGDGMPWIVLPSDASPGIVAHEAVHAAVAVCAARGLPVAAAADEVLAYLTEAIVDRVVPWLGRFPVDST